MLYYYVKLDQPLIPHDTVDQSAPLHTESLDELVLMIHNQKIGLLTDSQITHLNLPKDYNEQLRKIISGYRIRVPLYDIFADDIFLIYQENVYDRILYGNYRFIDKKFLKSLGKNPSPHYERIQRIFEMYDMDTLQMTYMYLFYKSFVLSSNVTSCMRPSFSSKMDHIDPYYSINELYYLAYDWNLIDKTTANEKEIRKLCKIIKEYDIPSGILLDHQMYIFRNKAMGLVKHYSLFGSYFINRYLRETRCCTKTPAKNVIRNLAIEGQINLMVKLIKNAPAFTKSHVVYRFVEEDFYLKHLKVGDIYQDDGFMSTTRNPFYYQKNYPFGYILIKIRLPKDISGIGLCIEAYSNFPSEEEIILPPTSMFKLERVTENLSEEPHYHIYGKIVKKKYEFTWSGVEYEISENIDQNLSHGKIIEIQKVNFQEIIKTDTEIEYVTMADRLRYFIQKYVNENNQFETTIGDTTYTFIIESYNSSNVYQNYFFYKTTTGLLIYSYNPRFGNINIMIEVGPELHVNYYFKNSITDSSHQLRLDNNFWIEFLCELSYFLGSKKVVIYPNYYILKYNSTDSLETIQMKSRYTVSFDIYRYLKHKEKYFEKFITEVTPNFDYESFDYLFLTKIDQVLSINDRDELYGLAAHAKVANMGEMYLYLSENIPKLLPLLEKKLSIYYSNNNISDPFQNMSYSLDAWNFLYNKELIQSLPKDKDFTIPKGSFNSLIGESKIRQFKNRLRTFLEKTKK